MSVTPRKMIPAAALTAAIALPVSSAMAEGEKIVAPFHDLAERFRAFMLGQ